MVLVAVGAACSSSETNRDAEGDSGSSGANAVAGAGSGGTAGKGAGLAGNAGQGGAAAGASGGGGQPATGGGSGAGQGGSGLAGAAGGAGDSGHANAGAGAGAGAGMGGAGGVAGTENGGAGGWDDGRVHLGVRFIGFTEESPPLELPTTTDADGLFPECPHVGWSQAEVIPVLTPCIASGIVDRMNAALAELVGDTAPLFYFESFEIQTEPALAVFESTDGNGPIYQLNQLQGNRFRKANTLTFVMPRASASGLAGLAFEDQRINPGFGALAIAVAGGGPYVFLHEFGHVLGLPHAGNLSGVGTREYLECGGVSLVPEACTCEPSNYMSLGIHEESWPAVEGCALCEFEYPSTYESPFFGPLFRDIAACWVERRLEPSTMNFVPGECASFVGSTWVSCDYDANEALVCTCPTGTTFPIENCRDDSSEARAALADATCERRTCEPPPSRPGVVCDGLLGGTQIECRCEDGSPFYMTDCSTLTLEVIEAFCSDV